MYRSFIGLATLFMATVVSSNTFEIDDWRINRLLSPSFGELQSEIIDYQLTCYGDFNNPFVDLALDKHFERIEFMLLGDCEIFEGGEK